MFTHIRDPNVVDIARSLNPKGAQDAINWAIMKEAGKEAIARERTFS
jgi:hypothetical protein